jgi:sugar lactone lactonase YvrE
MEVTNSISWSLDGRPCISELSYSKIYRHEYDADQGTLSNPISPRKSAAQGVPDGSCVDAEDTSGMRYGDQGLGRDGATQDPITGRVVFTVHMPDGTSQVTCCCFGGEDEYSIHLIRSRKS